MYLLKKLALRLSAVVVVFGALFGTPQAVESSATPLQTLYMVKQLLPQVKTVGLMWKKSDDGSSALLEEIKRASASLGVKIVIGDVESLTDVASQFRELTDSYHIEALWIIRNTDVLSNSTAMSYLVKNAALHGVPLFAPDQAWVNTGACAAVVTESGTTKLYVNQKTLNALGLKVPEGDASFTQVLANN